MPIALALQRPRRHERGLRMGEPAEQRGQREQGEPAHENPPPPEDVPRPAAEQQEAAEGQQVGVDHPRERSPRKAQVVFDRRQRHVHDRAVENDHQLRRANEQQRQSLAPTIVLQVPLHFPSGS
jgi:hypothetical protein